MAQVYVTTSKNDYRWNTQPPRQPIVPEVFLECDTNADLWLPPEKHVREHRDEEQFAKVVEAVRQLNLERLKSTYQKCFGRAERYRPVSKEEDLKLEHGFLDTLKPVYERTYDKVLPPVPLGRKRIGYSRPSRMYTPLTSYQREIGSPAYKHLKQYTEETLAKMIGTSEK